MLYVHRFIKYSLPKTKFFRKYVIEINSWAKQGRLRFVKKKKIIRNIPLFYRRLNKSSIF